MLSTLVTALLAQQGCGLETPGDFPRVPTKAYEATAADAPVVRRVRGPTPINSGFPQPQITD